uniref:Uncharacterized protein n=1 Tax=Arundo donax TaxID=35708 RepID=A0A0A9EJI1_ARUDO
MKIKESKIKIWREKKKTEIIQESQLRN